MEAIPADIESARLRRGQETVRRLLDNAETVVHGKREEIKLVLAALVCGGHVLLEDVPGTAKTVLARSLAGSLEGAAAGRIQCTPDLQPTDVTGLSIYDQRSRDFEFRPGPVFANVVLVDEINRATPKTQSALLEAMAELQVTIDGVTRPLPRPFLVLATENPIEHDGTFPLPEAQLDRFFLRSALGYPDLDDELRIVQEQHGDHPLTRLRPVVTADEVHDLRAALADVYIDPLVQRWAVELVRTTRRLEEVSVGGSVRGSLALEQAARAWALLEGRGYVVPEDVEMLFLPVLGHRVVLAPEFSVEVRGLPADEVGRLLLERCLVLTPRPEPDWEAGGTLPPRRTVAAGE